MPTMISDKVKRDLGKLLDDYNALPWYKKLFYPGALSAALRQYNKEAPSLERVSAIYNAYVNKTWFFQRWFFSSLISFSSSISSLGAEQLNDILRPNRLGELLPIELVNMVASNLTKEDVKEWAKTGRQAYSIFQAPDLFGKFLKCIAYGQQDKAEQLLRDVFKGQPEKIQAALQYQGKFTDYSGRTFNCTAYEYAYWAKDTHMCRMLERHMDDATKAYLFARINEIERIDVGTGQPVGLAYHQGGLEHRSAHFDLTPLISALQRYVDGYDNWERTNNSDAMKAAWMEVGLAQRDIPVHVLNEYCHPDRSFDPRPEFNEERLPRNIRFFDWTTVAEAALFPLVISDVSGLGIDFALTRGMWTAMSMLWYTLRTGAEFDLAAVSHLDEVRDADLTRSREILQSADPELGHSRRF
jgi:hypothetical protein